jgi:hypothetical protein
MRQSTVVRRPAGGDRLAEAAVRHPGRPKHVHQTRMLMVGKPFQPVPFGVRLATDGSDPTSSMCRIASRQTSAPARAAAGSVDVKPKLSAVAPLPARRDHRSADQPLQR